MRLLYNNKIIEIIKIAGLLLIKLSFYVKIIKQDTTTMKVYFFITLFFCFLVLSLSIFLLFFLFVPINFMAIKSVNYSTRISKKIFFLFFIVNKSCYFCCRLLLDIFLRKQSIKFRFHFILSQTTKNKKTTIKKEDAIYKLS